MVSELCTIYCIFLPQMNPRCIYKFILCVPGAPYTDFNTLIKELSLENLGFFSQVTYDA